MPTDRRAVRLLVVIRHPVGGIISYLRYTYPKLDTRKYRVMLVTPCGEHVEALRTSLRNLLIDVRVATGRHVLFSLAYAVARAIWFERFDLIHSQGATAGLVVSALNFFHRVPHVITLHETFDDALMEQSFFSCRSILMSFLFSRADVVHTVSHDAKENLLQYFGALRRRANKVIVIHNGVDIDYFTTSPSTMPDLRSLAGIDSATFVLGFLGRYMPEKGFHILIDAIDILAREHHPAKPVKVLALGWGAFIREYQADIGTRGLSKYFIFIEHQDDVRWVLRQVDCLVIPSQREAFPLLAVEALVSGTPVIASDCIGLREALLDSPAVTFPTGNPRRLADAILRAMKEPLKSKAHNHVPFAKRQFDVTESAAKLQQLFARVLTVGR
jgi:glycosyltransferase involved in cell wall biosynthesis